MSKFTKKFSCGLAAIFFYVLTGTPNAQTWQRIGQATPSDGTLSWDKIGCTSGAPGTWQKINPCVTVQACSASFLSTAIVGTDCSIPEGRNLVYVGMVDGFRLASEKEDAGVAPVTAPLCSNQGGGLPSIAQLEAMYANRLIIGGFKSSGYYWSRSSFQNVNMQILVFVINFQTGMRNASSNRQDAANMRCIRQY